MAESTDLRRLWFSLSKGIEEGAIEHDVAKEMFLNAVHSEISNRVTVYEPKDFGKLLNQLKVELGGSTRKHPLTDVDLRRIIASEHAKKCRERAESSSSWSGLKDDFKAGGVFDQNLLENNLRTMELTVQSWGDRPPIRFGIRNLDEAFGGLLPGELCALVGSPGAMKTSLGLSAVEYFTRNSKGKTMFVSVDMPPEEISLRLVLRECFDQYGDVELKQMAAKQDPIYLKAKTEMLGKYKDRLSIIGHRPHRGLSLTGMLEEAAIKMPDFIVIDFLTQLKDLGESDLKIVERAMPAIKDFAEECQVPVILLSQMGRASRSEQNSGKMGGHAKGGGIVEELCTVEIELVREPSSEGRKPEIVATVIKTRRGEAGKSFFLDYVGKSMRFTGHSQKATRQTGRKAIFERSAEL